MWARLFAVAVFAFLFASAFGFAVAPARGSASGTGLASATPEFMKYIQINSFRFDPLAETPRIPADLRYESVPPNVEGYYLVQFTGPVTSSMKGALESSGAKILQYIPYNAFVVRADSADIARAGALPVVRWTGVFEPAYKLSPTLAQSYDAVVQKAMDESLYGSTIASGEPTVAYSTLSSRSINPQSAPGQASYGGAMTRAGPATGSAAQASFGPSGSMPTRIDTSSRIAVTINTFEESRVVEVARAAFALGGREVGVSFAGDGIVKADVPRAVLPALARQLGVLWIDRDVQPFVFNDIARWTVQSSDEDTFGTPIHDKGIWGTGQTVTLADTGIDYEHNAFQDPNVTEPGPDHRKVTDYYPVCDFNCDESDNGFANHGTHTSGSVGGDDGTWHVYDGDGTGSNGSAGPHDGQAFDAFIHMQDTSNDGFFIYFDDILDLWEPAVARESWIHSNSWGSCCAEYISEAAITDEFIFNNQDFLVVFAAANFGCVGCMNPFAGAKNVVAVGGTQNGPSRENMYDFSSRGPMNDGRIKPDVTAPAVSLWSARGCDPGGECDDYWTLTGTSMATPTVAGSAALIRQYFMDGWYPTGTKEAGNGFTPSAALLKAMLVNSAVEMTGSGAYDNGWDFYPNFNQGFGRILLDDAMFFQEDVRGLVIDDHRTGIETGDTVTYELAIGDGSVPVEITLVYSDWPGTPGVSPNLVNDLDLVVTAPDGTVYHGNQYVGMNPGESERNPDDLDRLNNVEAVLVITDPPQGVWTVEVQGFNIPEGPQSFALVMTGGIATEKGVVTLDKNRYQSSATVNVKVIDTGLNLDPNAPDSAEVDMTSTTETVPEIITLTETGNATSVFAGSIVLQGSETPAPDGQLQVQNGDTIIAEYFDADDGLGGSGPTTDTAVVDDDAPVITGISAVDVRFNRASIEWTTDEASDSVVRWGLTAPPANTASSAQRVLDHSIDLTGLIENTTYFYSVESTDEAGNTAIDDNAGAYYQFTTATRPPTAPPNADWPTMHNNVPRQGISPSNFLPPIDKECEAGPFLLQLWNGPIYHEDMLFTGSLDGVLRAWDAFSCEPLWDRQLGDQFFYTGTMAANEGVIYATFYGFNGGFVYALDAFTGETIWSVGLSDTSLDFNARIPMAYADGLVFGTTWNGQAYALDATNGAVVWTASLDSYTIGGAALAEGTAYFATVLGQSVYAFDEFSGDLLWSTRLDNYITGTPMVAQGNVYVGTYSGTQYALDAATGEVVWQTGGFGLIDVSTPAYDGTAIYFGTFGGSEYVSVDATDGTVLWRTRVGAAVGTSPAYANGYLYATAWDGTLYVIDVADGTIVEREDLRSFGSTSFPAVAEGVVWLEDYEGYVYAFFGQLAVGLLLKPSRQAMDATPDSTVDYTLTVWNRGVSGPDVFDATVLLGELGWATELFDATGTDPLEDTDGDGIPDTGAVPAEGTIDVVIRVTVPAEVFPGDVETARVTFTSSVDPTLSKTAQVTTTVPPPGVAVGPRIYVVPQPGDTIVAELEVRNTGGFPDTIDMTWGSDLGWTMRVFQADGVSPLEDTDDDGIVDVGLVPGLESVGLVVEVDVPLDVPLDTLQRAAVTGTSTLNESISHTGYVIAELLPPPDEQWPTFHNNKRRQGESPSPHEPPIKELWRSGAHQLHLWTSPVVADNILFSTTLDGYLRAYDPFTGDIIWEQAFGDTFYYTGTVTVDHRGTPEPGDGVVYATFYGYDGGVIGTCPRDAPFYGTCGYVFALDAEDGSLLWKVGPDETGLNFNARPAMALSGGRVIGTTWNDFINGQVFALDATTGQLLWLFNATGLPFAGAAVGGGTVYIGSLNGWLYALDELSGSLVWSVRLGTITSVPLVTQGMVIVGDSSGKMHALDANSGTEIWSTDGFGGIDSSTPATDGSAIYFGTFNFNNPEYVSLDLLTGAVLWRTSIGGPVGSSVALANGYMYGTAWDGRLRTLNASNGDIVDTDPLVSFASTASPAIQRGWIWLEDYSGIMYAFGGEGAGELRTLLVAPGEADVEVGKALLLKAHGRDAFENPIRVKDADWLPREGLGSVVKVSGDTALFVADIIAGTETVEASAMDEDEVEHVGLATVYVRPGPLDRIQVAMNVSGSLFEGAVSIPAGEQRRFQAAATDRFGNVVGDEPLTWSVTGGIGTINANGVFTASTTVGVGFVVASHESGRTGRQQVTVTPGPPATMDIDLTSTSVAVDSHSVVVATVRDAYSNANPDGEVRWTTTGTGTILLLTPDGRSILYHAPITTTLASVELTATIDANGDGVPDASRTITLTIVAGPPVGISIDAPATTVAVGGTLDFSAVVTDQFGNPVTGATLAWETTGGSINQQGVFTAPSEPGLVVITASTAGREAFVVVEVTSGGFEQFSRQATTATSLALLLATIVAVAASVFMFVRYRESRRELEEMRRGGQGGGSGGLG